MARLDDIDRQLLMLLQEDDRQPLAALSEKTGVAVSTINDRIKRLVRSGMISGFHARIAPEAIGLNLLAFIMVKWSNPKVEAIFLGRVKASPDVLECHHITGAWNYLLKVRVGTTRVISNRSHRHDQGGGWRGANRDADHPFLGEGDVDGQFEPALF